MKHVIKYESPYEYGNFSSEDRKEGRFYDCNGTKLPSVTTILSATKKDKESLTRWIERVGEEEANRIRDEAAARGSHVHYILEKQIVHGDLWDYRPDSGEEKRAYKMACKLWMKGFLESHRSMVVKCLCITLISMLVERMLSVSLKVNQLSWILNKLINLKSVSGLKITFVSWLPMLWLTMSCMALTYKKA